MNTIGEELQKKRQEVNLTLDHISEKTNIKSAYLLNIENGEFDELPTFVHAKGFVKIYANFLGLDGLEYSKRLGNSKNSNNIHLQEPYLTNSKKINSVSKFQEISEKIILILIKKRKKIFIAAVIFIAFIFVVKLIKFIASPSQKQEAINKEMSDVRQSKPKEETVLLERLDLKITALESVWVTVKIDNKSAFEGILSKNASESWSAKEKIEMKIGDAGGVKLLLNEKEITEIGKKGDVVKKLVITKKGIEIS